MMYTVYHAPQLKKVGCTNNFERRMKEQDLDLDQVEIKFRSSDIEEASLAEETLRDYYGYKEDSPMTYLQKIKPAFGRSIVKSSNTPSVGWNQLHVGATKEELRSDLNKYENVILKVDGQEFKFTPDEYDELSKKAKASQYKDFYWQVTTLKKLKDANIRSGDNSGSDTIKEFEQIRAWAIERGLYDKGDPKTQFLKLQEEAGEVARAILKNDQAEIVDGLGDCLVVLINLAHLAGYRLEDCLAEAYKVISKRKGSMINGTFVKEE